MKVILAGGTGQIGAILARAFHAAGHEVVVLSRRPNVAPWRTAAWDARTLGDWTAALDGADARYPERVVGSSDHRELWVPADELAAFDEHLVGLIEIVATFTDTSK